jgi:hypothetical protein
MRGLGVNAWGILWVAVVGTLIAGPGCGAEKVTGIAECDDYLSKYQKCVEHLPAERKEAFEQHLERTRAAWVALAKNPGTRPALHQSCSLSLEAARSSTAQYHCTW